MTGPPAHLSLHICGTRSNWVRRSNKRGGPCTSACPLLCFCFSFSRGLRSLIRALRALWGLGLHLVGPATLCEIGNTPKTIPGYYFWPRPACPFPPKSVDEPSGQVSWLVVLPGRACSMIPDLLRVLYFCFLFSNVLCLFLRCSASCCFQWLLSVDNILLLFLDIMLNVSFCLSYASCCFSYACFFLFFFVLFYHARSVCACVCVCVRFSML